MARWWPALLVLGQAWCAWRSRRAWRGLPELPPEEADAGAPSVSIVVPARDEAATLPHLLPSLLAQRYPSFDVTVVDDGSTDGTAAVAAAWPVSLVPAPPLPAGWAGKPHACAIGAARTTGAWLLFTDADTRHAPLALASAMAYARAHSWEAVTLFPRQRCGTFWERLLVPYAFRHYFAGVDIGGLGDGRTRDALINGQYLLIRRGAYERIGGHRAVRASVIEYVALAAVLRRAGVPCARARAGSLVEVRMYNGFTAIRRGFAKNSSRFLLANPRGGALTLLSTMLDGIALPLLLTGAARRRPLLAFAGLAAWGVGAAGLAPWLPAAGVARWRALLQPLAAAAFQVIALDGVRSLRPGATTWKGRRY